jgi:pre-rRNA-processing protein TSR1
MFDNMQIKVVGGTGSDNMSDDGDISSGSDEDEDEGDLEDDEYFKEDLNKISKIHQRHIDLEERDRDDMEFPDEVDTPFKNARKRFEKFRGIKSLRNCDWDPYENLPEEYSKIWRF